MGGWVVGERVEGGNGGWVSGWMDCRGVGGKVD